MHKAHSLQLFPDALVAAVNVPDITSHGLEMNAEVRADVTAGESSPTHVAVVAQKPAYDVTTYALATMLDNVGTKGLGIDSDTNPGVTAFLQSFDDFGEPLAGSVHRSYLIKKGLIVPRNISVDHQGDAQLNCDLLVLKKSGNDAVVISDVAALPTISIVSDRWTLGPIDVAGKTLSDYTGFQIDFGNEVSARSSQSDVFDTHIDQKTHSPTLTVSGINPAWFSSANITIGGVVATHANSILHLRKRTQDGTEFVSNLTAEHIKFTLAGLTNVSRAMQGEATRLSETSLRVVAAKDSSGNDPLIVDTTSTHP